MVILLIFYRLPLTKHFSILHFRLLFLTSDESSNRNLASYSLVDGTLDTLNDATTGISTHLSVDVSNKMIYWIHFTNETSYDVYKTTYNGSSWVIDSGVRTNDNLDITQGAKYCYIKDSIAAKINTYDKETNMKTNNT